MDQVVKRILPVLGLCLCLIACGKPEDKRYGDADLYATFREPQPTPRDVVKPEPTPWPEEIEVSQLRALLSSEHAPFLLDVRQPEEWDAGHMENATLIPLGELPGRINELPHDKPIVVYCRSGNRSVPALKLLRENGFANSGHLAGGYLEWIQTPEFK